MPSYALPPLSDRAALAIHCLTHHVDPQHGYIPYFYTQLSMRPLGAYFDIWSYGDGLGRSVDALALCRTMTGQAADVEPVDRAMRETLIGLIRDDGLSWCPAQPWTLAEAHTRPAWLQQGTLLALTSIYQLTGNASYRRLAEKNIDGILKIARRQDGYLDFPGDAYTAEHGWHVPEQEDPFHKLSVFSTSVTMPLMRFYRLTGYEPARELASGLINWGLRDHDGGRKLFDRGHFHCQSRLMTALLMRGVAQHSDADLELGEWLYRKARRCGTLAGWFPEQIDNPEMNRSGLSETCCLTDMIESAILLAQHRSPLYWNDVERYARNYLLVHQHTRMDWVDQLTERPESTMPGGHARLLHLGERSDRFRQTLIGGFVGWGGVAALSDDTPFGNMNQHCCNGAGARALYDVWYHTVSDRNREFTVNLHLQRNHAAAEITVTEAEALEMTIKLKADRRLRVRVPEFVAPAEFTVSLPFHIADGFADCGEVRAGTTVAVRYPLRDAVTREPAADNRMFEYRWHGATVMGIAPVYGVSPLFVPERFAAAAQSGPVAAREVEPF